MLLNSVDQNLISEEITVDGSYKPDLLGLRPPSLEDDEPPIHDNSVNQIKAPIDEIFQLFSEDFWLDNFSDEEKVDLKEEFDNFAAIIKSGEMETPHNIYFLINLSEESADSYLKSFTPKEFSDLIHLLLDTIKNNPYYKYPCIAILGKWILNLRRPFFHKYGYNIFGNPEITTQISDSPITPVFENELTNTKNNELQLATNMLRMPMI